ncbi:CdaR family transcriptional regulator [Terrabacter sp. GCM10028922]|uniref:CdaR family transcriptional regulator n=1 Tax=Terrabacter sp. GCM10028922 TaxID=3273428 RepID=UPI003609A508
MALYLSSIHGHDGGVLSPVLAQQIARETTEAIGHNVIITDQQGWVIGSGDARRVGTWHEASVAVVESRQAAWHSPEEARPLQGVRPGITLPLVIDGNAVGTVGITGSPRQVRRFGLLVRRQTEILLEESALLRSRLLRERALEDLASEIAAFDVRDSDPALIAAAARDLGLDLEQSRVPVLITLGDAVVGAELLRTVRAVFHQPQDLVAVRSATRILALVAVSRGVPDAAAVASLACEAVERLDARARAGVGEVASGIPYLRVACDDAADALELGTRRVGGGPVTCVWEVRTLQAVAAMPRKAQHRLLASVGAPLLEAADGSVLRDTVIAWCESGFSLVAAAQALHVHRNTLVYRLEKIERLTAAPWREHSRMLSMYLACLAARLADANNPSGRAASNPEEGAHDAPAVGRG